MKITSNKPEFTPFSIDIETEEDKKLLLSVLKRFIDLVEERYCNVESAEEMFAKNIIKHINIL